MNKKRGGQAGNQNATKAPEEHRAQSRETIFGQHWSPLIAHAIREYLKGHHITEGEFVKACVFRYIQPFPLKEQFLSEDNFLAVHKEEE